MRIALSGNISTHPHNPSRVLMVGQTKAYAQLLPEKGFDVYLFHWKNLKEDGTIQDAYHVGRGFKDIDAKKDVDLVAIRQLGSLVDSRQKFFSFLGYLDQLNTTVANDPKKMRENTDKKYLIDLKEQGYPIIPTQILEEDDSLISIINRYEEDAVLKPRVLGEGGNSVKLATQFESAEEFQRYRDSQEGGVVIQPYMEGIKKGEISLFFLGDKYSHALLKKSMKGDFRVNLSFGAEYESYSPTRQELEIGFNIIDHYRDHNQMTRMDFVQSPEGPLIMEVERINPAPYILKNELNIEEYFTNNFANFLRRNYDQ